MRVKSKKPLAIAASLALVAVLAVGATVAWLTAKTDTVTNTFTVGDINITLTETGATDNAKSYDFVPGDTLEKDPKVTVVANSEACYLFVRVTDANNTATGLTGKVINWTVREGADGWTPVPNHDGFWYREVDATTADVSFYVLAAGETKTVDGETTVINPNGQVTVNENVTKEMVSELKGATPQIKITAAAIQKDNIADVATAFDKLPNEFTNLTAGA